MQVYGVIRYDKIREIGVGQGLNSTVYLAHDPHLNRGIAVKEIDSSRLPTGGWDAYHREAQAMFAARHDNVVPIHYACRTATHLALAMPYFPRGSLQDGITAGPLPLFESYRIADRFLGALSQIHVANLLHFDLKPTNVLFSETDEPLIADFGQARLMDPTGLAPVPPMYKWGIPPEAFTHGAGTVESDIYQAGLTLYRLFNGDPYFRNQIANIHDPYKAMQQGRLPNRSKFMPHLPPGIRRVVRKALQIDPRDRYHSALEFQDVLSRVDLTTDWETRLGAGGEMTWTAHRVGRPAYEVHRLLDGSRHRWKVEVFTVSGSRRQRKGSGELWANNLSAAEADQHLRDVLNSF